MAEGAVTVWLHEARSSRCMIIMRIREGNAGLLEAISVFVLEKPPHAQRTKCRVLWPRMRAYWQHSHRSAAQICCIALSHSKQSHLIVGLVHVCIQTPPPALLILAVWALDGAPLGHADDRPIASLPARGNWWSVVGWRRRYCRERSRMRSAC